MKKQHGIVSRIVSCVLALAMVLTMMQSLPSAVLNAHADGGEVKVYFKLPSGTTASEWGINVWGGATVQASDTKASASWGAEYPALLADSNSGWAYATLTGTVQGIQFVNSNTDYNCWNSVISIDNYSAAYFDPSTGKWYKESSCTNEIVKPDPRDIYVLTGASGLTGQDWQLDEQNCALVQDTNDPNKYSITFYDVAEGTYEYKILQDPKYYAWELPWGSGSGSGENRSVTVSEASDVTFSIDLTDPDKDVTDKGVTVTQVPTTVAPPTFDKSTITVHFQNTGDWTDVYAKIAEGSSWNPVDGYAYAHSWPGAKIEQDTANNGWYSFTITVDASTALKLIFNNKGNGVQTSNIEFSADAENIEKWYAFGTTTTELPAKPEGWITSTEKAPTNASPVTSPEVNGRNVTFRCVDASATQVRLAGAMTEWETNAIDMVKGADDVWSVTVTLAPGAYQYQFIKDSNGWTIDPANSRAAGNNSLVVVPGLTDGSLEVEKGVAAALPELTLYTTDGTPSTANPTYQVITEAAKDYVTIADGKVTVSEGFTGDSFQIKATEGTATSTITVKVVQKMYTYTIYYYDWTADHMATGASALWIWQDGGAGGVEYPFTDKVELADGNNWLKAEVKVSYYDKIKLIPKVASTDRNNPVWTWQGKTYSFSNSSQEDEATIYIVSNKSKVYTSLPELTPPRDRYVEIEYQRPENDYDGWEIYTWNSGYGDEVTIPFEQKGNKMVAEVPVIDSDADMNLSFCVKRSTDDNEWAEKDGGDHSVTIPTNQTVVKAVFVQGQGITEVLPYNTGYVRDGANDQIHFYYRDDTLYKEYNLSSLTGKVQIWIDGETYDMSYDSANERFYYDLTGLTSRTTYHYYYLVDGEKKLDDFNTDATESFQGQECNVCTYLRFDDVSLTAELSQTSMDYNDNNVLTVKAAGADGQPVAGFEVAEASVDASALGIGTLDIEPELMAVTLSCTRSTATGVKSLPITVKDIYGNIYNTTAQVTVTARDKSDGDFDWDEAVIYFAVTDRFFDGSSSNNTGVDKDGSLSYHGGDFVGLTQKLDYLQDLGVNTIWITPIVENSDTTTDKDGETIESTGYHGYWASDFTELNSHLGTEAEFKALIDAAHSRNMKIMVDVVVNHAGYGTEEHFNTIIQDSEGNYVSMLRDDENTISGDDVYDGLSGLPDFVTEDATVRNQIIEWQTDWMEEFDIDYYRVDTVKHVDETTWSAFKNALAKSNPDFKLIGEYSGGGYSNDFDQLGTGRMDSLLDFDFNDMSQNFVTGNISTVESTLEKRNAVINNTYVLGSFMNSHDEDGLQAKLQDANNLSETEAENLMKVAATLMITAKGQPIIYYGEEIGQYGRDDYPYQTNRYDFDWAELEVQKTDSNSIYNHYKTMLSIRNDYTDVFVQGDRKEIAVSDTEGYEVISRSYGDTTLYVGMNIKDAAKEVIIPVSGEAGSVYTNLYDGKEYTVAADQTVSISIPAAKNGGTIVLAEKEDDGFLRYIEVTGDDYSEVINSVTKATDGTITVVLPADSKKVPAEVFNKAAGKNITLVFVVSDSASWTVSAKTITSEITSAIDLDVILNTTNIPSDIVSALAGSNKTMQFSLGHDGKFGFDGSLTLTVGDTYKGKYANLYYYNPTTKALEYQQAVVVTTDGKVTFTFKHASDYVIVFADTDLKPADPTTEDPKPADPTSPTTPADTTPKETPTVEAPKTGDETPMVTCIVVLLFSGLAMAALFRKRIRRS
ncbi:MAG: alpha-amylase family glycosyl hydrolase [Roseburia sp.]